MGGWALDLPEKGWLHWHEPHSCYFDLCPGFVFVVVVAILFVCLFFPPTVENYGKSQNRFLLGIHGSSWLYNPDSESVSRRASRQRHRRVQMTYTDLRV